MSKLEIGRSGGMADVPDSKSGAPYTGVWVQVPPSVLMRDEKSLRILSNLLSEKQRALCDSSEWDDDYLDPPAWFDYLLGHSILFCSTDELWILLNQMGDRVLVLNESSPYNSRFLLVPGDFADKALVLGFLPE